MNIHLLCTPSIHLLYYIPLSSPILYPLSPSPPQLSFSPYTHYTQYDDGMTDCSDSITDMISVYSDSRYAPIPYNLYNPL